VVQLHREQFSQVGLAERVARSKAVATVSPCVHKYLSVPQVGR
jgi:hypothetical protein